MERIGQLLTFAKEFLADASFDKLNENIIWTLKEATDKAMTEMRAEIDLFWDTLTVPQSLKARYVKMNRDCKSLLSRLSSSGAKGPNGLRPSPLFSISDDEEESFENPRVCFDGLKAMMLDLEIEYNHYARTQTEEVQTDPNPQGKDEVVKVPLVLFSDFADVFSKLNRVFRYRAQKTGGADPKLAEDVSEARTLILDCQKDKLLVHLLNRIRDTNKIIKLLGKMLQSCRVLYGDKLIFPIDLPVRRKESNSEKMSSLQNRPVSSLKLSMNLSKIRVRPSYRIQDSFANEVSEFFAPAETSARSRSVYEPRFVNPRRREGPPLNLKGSYQGQALVIKQLPDEGAFGRCYCALF